MKTKFCKLAVTLWVSVIIPGANTLPAQMTSKPRLMSADWAPKGDVLFLSMGVFAGAGTPPSSAIYKYDLTNDSITLITTNASSPTFSPGGEKMAFVRRSGAASQVYIREMNSGKEYPLFKDSLMQNAPTWSADGKFIAYNVNQGSEVGIYKYELASGKPTLLVGQNGYKNYTPVSSPSGKRVAYYLEKGDRHDQIFTVESSGRNISGVTNDPATHNFYPSWLNEDEIIYTQFPNGIFKISINGGVPTKMQEFSSSAFAAKYSTNANKIAVLNNNPSSLVIYDMAQKKVIKTIDPLMLKITF